MKNGNINFQYFGLFVFHKTQNHINFGFSYRYIKYGKFWSISLEHFVEHKLWIWEECILDLRGIAIGIVPFKEGLGFDHLHYYYWKWVLSTYFDQKQFITLISDSSGISTLILGTYLHNSDTKYWVISSSFA